MHGAGRAAFLRFRQISLTFKKQGVCLNGPNPCPRRPPPLCFVVNVKGFTNAATTNFDDHEALHPELT